MYIYGYIGAYIGSKERVFFYKYICIVVYAFTSALSNKQPFQVLNGNSIQKRKLLNKIATKHAKNNKHIKR